MKPTETTDLTVEQRAELAKALELIRGGQSLRYWTQFRYPAEGEPRVVRLIRYSHGRIAQVHNVWVSR